MTPSPLRMLGDERLARMVTTGHDAAFAALYDRYRDVLVRYCRSLVRDDQDALDAFQTTMLNALRALREDRRNAPVRPWLFRIAHNESVSVLRRRPNAEPLDDRQAGAADVHHLAESREALAGLLEDLTALTDHQRGALLLRELGGLGYEEVATALETTPLAARQAVFAARASLHDQRAGRELPCAMVQRRLSDSDRRAARSRAVRAHLRRCDDCRGFANAIGRRRRAAVLIPVPPAFASSGLLASVLDSAGGSAGVAGGSAVASGLVAKAAVALSAAVVATGATTEHRAPAQRAAVPEATARPAPRAATTHRTAATRAATTTPAAVVAATTRTATPAPARATAPHHHVTHHPTTTSSPAEPEDVDVDDPAPAHHTAWTGGGAPRHWTPGSGGHPFVAAGPRHPGWRHPAPPAQQQAPAPAPAAQPTTTTATAPSTEATTTTTTTTETQTETEPTTTTTTTTTEPATTTPTDTTATTSTPAE
jgi:RNA polymerase sigma factor (sigma-70 family)